MAQLTDEELLETLESQLPALLERHPELETRIYTAFMRTFVTRREVAAVLSELRDFRGEFGEFRSQVEGHFDGVDQRFEKVEEHFDGVDQRFEKVEGRFDGVDQRLEKVEGRFDGVDQRFDHMDQRFSDLKDWVELVVGRFQTRSGRKLEDVVAGTLRLALEREDIASENVRLRQAIEDIDGMIGPAGRRYEVDILADNGILLAFEVKSVCEGEDVDRFADKVALMRTLHPDKTVDGVMVTLAPREEVEARCVEWGIKLVH